MVKRRFMDVLDGQIHYREAGSPDNPKLMFIARLTWVLKATGTAGSQFGGRVSCDCTRHAWQW